MSLTFPSKLLSYFLFQIVIIEYKSIICAGYSAVLHIHSAVEEVQIKVRILNISDRRRSGFLILSSWGQVLPHPYVQKRKGMSSLIMFMDVYVRKGHTDHSKDIMLAMGVAKCSGSRNGGHRSKQPKLSWLKKMSIYLLFRPLMMEIRMVPVSCEVIYSQRH